MAIAWERWTRFHKLHGFAIDHFLHAPATDADLDAIEADTGYRLPDDLRCL